MSKFVKDPSTQNLPTGQCHFIKPDASHCKAFAMKQTSYCYLHNPDVAQERQAARVKGGKERSRRASVLPADTPDRPLTTLSEVDSLLVDMVNQVLRGEIGTSQSHAVNALLGTLHKTRDLENIEHRLGKVESTVAQKWTNPMVALEPTAESTNFEFVKPEIVGGA